ncbi:MAG: hypothetical protein INR73_28790 [Williamsia sp.]|nr:hypothetical protein [Williamsia sp.]
MLRLLSISIFLTIAFSSCLSLADGHSATLIKESSNGRHTKKAVLFLLQGGATADNSYQVSMTNYENQFDTTQVGNTFTVDTNHGATGLDSNSIGFSWLGDDTLQIDYDKKLRTFIQQTSIDGITIVYKKR